MELHDVTSLLHKLYEVLPSSVDSPLVDPSWDPNALNVADSVLSSATELPPVWTWTKQLKNDSMKNMYYAAVDWYNFY